MTQGFFDTMFAPLYSAFGTINIDENYLQFAFVLLMIIGVLGWFKSLFHNI